MSAKIFCDRCGREDTGKFYNVSISAKPGVFANIAARYCGSGPWLKDVHLCGYCHASLVRWTEDTK